MADYFEEFVTGRPGVVLGHDEEGNPTMIGRENCEYVGHEWAPAGGGLLICMRCEIERWADER